MTQLPRFRKLGLIPLFAGLCFLAAAPVSRSQTKAQEPAQDLLRVEIPYQDGAIVLTADDSIRKEGARYKAIGHVRITFEDIVITCDAAEYDEITHEGFTSGPTRFSQNKTWFQCSRAEFNFGKQTGKFYEASGYTDEEFLVQGQTMLKTGRDTYALEKGSLTACQEPQPKWKFEVGKANIQLNKTARLHSVLFKIKSVPVFYFPYLIVPMEGKKRSSGFVPFHLGNSSNKGRQVSLGYYQTLGSSAELTLVGDYFSKRGFGLGGIFRARPNEQTTLAIQASGINDRQGQGGAHILVDGETLFSNGFRAAAKVNITSNFAYRQVFSEGFRSATIPEEQALVFATRAFGSMSTNFSYDRREVFFPDRSLVIRKSPSLELVSLGKSFGTFPLILSLRAAAEGLFRSDSEIVTPDIVQRLDVFPRVALRLPSFAGFSLFPSAGIRETYYSVHLSDDATPTVVTSPLIRQYTEFGVELRTPGLERTFASPRFGELRHLVEPYVTYRRIHGITNERKMIRFDDQDAIADTNEVEYGIVNRLMRRREIRPGVSQEFEFLTLEVKQKYYFDPGFGGAFLPGESNQFYPLSTLTGFSATGISSHRSPTSLSLRLTPRPGIYYDVRADYDTKLGRLRDASFWGVFRRDPWLVSGTYIKANALEPAMFSANHIQAQLAYRDPNKPGFSGSVTLSYNIQENVLLNSSSRLNYGWNCCGIALDYQQYALGLRTENRFTFSFTLKGIGHFGNLKRPEGLF